jgi:hypothetical protein
MLRCFLLFLIYVYFPLKGICQSVTGELERDVYYNLNDLLPMRNLNEIQVSLKVIPSYAIKGCLTDNFLSIRMKGSISNIPKFLTFDIYYKNCNKDLYYKSISIPISRAEIKTYLNISTNIESDQSIVLGTDDNSRYNNNFKFQSENVEKIDNVRITNTYNGGQIIKVEDIQDPTRINISNQPGEQNSNNDRAEFNSKVKLSITGGTLPSGGFWTWYDDANNQNVIGTGRNIEYRVNTKKPEIQISVIGSTTDSNKKTKPLNKILFVEIKQMMLKEIEILLNDKNLEKALEEITILKESYPNDTNINKKYEEIRILLDKKLKLEEDESMKNIINKEYSFLIDFPNQDKSIKGAIQDFLNEKLYNRETKNGFYHLDFDVEYKRNDRYHLKSGTLSNFNNLAIDRLINVSKSFAIPRISYANGKYTEVNVNGNYKFNIEVESKSHIVYKISGRWESQDINLLNAINKNYNTLYNTYSDGKYSIFVKSIGIGNSKYLQTSGSCIKRLDGPSNVLKSVFIPSAGRSKVGLTNGKLINIAIFSLAALSISSKLYSNSEYRKFLNANNQKDLDQSYQNANSTNKVSLISAGLGITIYSYNLISVFSKGKQNQNNLNSNNMLPEKSDKILLF